jgi:hypothetical protein
MNRNRALLIILFTGINLCFSAKQVIYGSYALFNIDIPNYTISSDTILWKYYNQDEEIIIEGVLTPSLHTPGLSINDPGKFSFYFETNDYYGALVFTLKTTIDNTRIKFDATYMDSKHQWIQDNKGQPNLIDDLYIEFNYNEYLKNYSGFLEIITNPENANVYIDNEFIGKTPLSGHNIFEGNYELKIDGADINNCIQFEPKYKYIDIVKSEYLFINDTLNLIPADIILSSIPPESRLFINKNDYGNIKEKGTKVSIPPGENRFIFSLGKHYFSKKQFICSGNYKWTFNLIKRNAKNSTNEKIENAWLTLNGNPNYSRIKIKDNDYNAPLSYLPINTNTKSIVVESDGFLNKIIDLSEYNLQSNKHLELKYKLEAINYSRALRLSRFYFDGKFFSGFTGFGHFVRNEKIKGFTWMGLQFIGIGAAIHSYTLINSYHQKKQTICKNYEIAPPQYVEQSRQYCINAVKEQQLAITYSVGINMFNAYIHFLSIWDFNR